MATNLITRRRQDETSKIFSQLADKNKAINVSINEAINNVLNNQFAQSSNLNTTRQTNQQIIKELNDTYARVTQDVLDDKALDFLIQHSQIDAPTLTSIFAGFELAKAARANRLNQQRQTDIQDIEAKNKIDAQIRLDSQKTADLRVKQLEATRDDDIKSIQKEADALVKSALADVTASERATKTAEDRTIRVGERVEDAELSRELQNIRSAPKTKESDKATLFNNLRSGSVTTQTTGIAPDPVTTTSVPTTVQQGVTLSQSDQLSSDEISLLNHDRNLLNVSDPTNIFASQLTSSSTVAALNQEEQLFLQNLRQTGGAASAIQQLNDDPNNGVNINQIGELTRGEIELLSFRREDLNTTDVPSNPIVNESNLDDDELLLLGQIRENNLAREEVTGDELINLTQQRRFRLGEEVPLESTNITGLQSEDLAVINRARLDQLIAPTINTATSDETILFNPDIVQQIDLLNQREDVESVDPLTVQQTLLGRDVDVAGLTLEEFNKLFEEGL